jgi:AcrR family transcriptional regulator
MPLPDASKPVMSGTAIERGALVDENSNLPQDKTPRENDKRFRILAAAQEIISEKGMKKATITEIATCAGVVDSIIYHYFKNKEDLVFSVLDVELGKALEELAFQFQGIVGAVSKLGKLVWYHLYMNDHGNARLRKNLLLECRAHRNFQKHKSYGTMLQYGRVMEGILREGISEGVFRGDLKPPVARTMIFGLLDEESLLSVTEPEPLATLPDFDQIMALILAMIEPDPPASSHEKPDKSSAILGAAKSIFAEKGFHNATMGDVALQAGVAEGTIYEYFQNKQDLLLSICKDYFRSYKSELDQAFSFDDPVTKLRRLIWHHFSIFAADSELVTVFVKDIKFNKHFYTTDAITDFLDYHKKISEVIEEGKSRGVFRQDIENRIFRNLVIGSFSNLYTRWYFRELLTPMAYMDEMNHFVDLLCRGVIAPPARTLQPPG